MSTALEPVIQSRLEQFRRRRQLLQLARGLAWAVTTALVVLLAVVIIDASIVMGQAWRWLLSLMIYGSLLAWLLATCRRVWRRETLPRTASLVEQLEPKFREQLVSAVELSQDTTANRLSSAGFRARLQQQVARAIEPVSMRKLLPWSLVARALVFAILALVACMSLSLVPQLHWPHRVARALLPGANLGRISRFQIEILAPQPATTCLPLGDVAAIEARVLGAVPSNVWLETRLSDSGERQAMRGVARGSDTGRLALPKSASAQVVEIAAEDLIYAANLTLTAEDLEYRVVADDAHTPWYRLTTQPRPQAVQFIKQLRFPDYSGLPSQQLSDSHGDIQALRGTSVRLEVVCDSAIERGWLEWQPAEEATAKRIDLQPVSSSLAKRLTAELRIDTDANYRVHLEAAQTHFTNAFSPEYQVRALVDQPPRLAWQQPQTNMLVVEPNQLVPLEVQIQDELPLAELALFTSINGEPAVQTAVAPPDQAEATAKVELDLLTARPKIGDTIRLLFQGTDRQGQSTSTPPIELIVSSTAVDPQRRPATEGRLELASELRRLSEQVTPQLKRVRELNDQISKQADTEATAELAATAKELAANAGTTAKALREKVMTQLKLPQDAVSLAELERTGQVLARIESQLGQAVTTAVAALEDPAAEQSKQPAVAARERAGRVRTAVEQLGDATSVLDRRFREFVAHDVLSEIARGLHVVQDYQQQLASAAEDITPAQLRRRQAIVARQLRELEQVMIDRSPLLREAAAHGLRGWIDWTGQLAERIERASADTDDNPNFKQFTKQVLNEVNQHQGVMSVDSGLASEINNGRKELDARSQSSAGILKNLAQQLAQSANQSAADPAAASAQPAAAMERLAQESVAYLQQRKELQQARSDSDAQFTSDLGNALRATKKITSSASVEPSTAKQQLIAAAAALQRLEAVHNVAEANDYLKALEQTERWNASSVEASTESPRAWDALQQRLEQAARALREAGVESKLASAVDALRGTRSSTEAAQKITARRWSSETHVSAEAELAELRQRFDDTLAQLDLVAAAARQELNGMAPQIPELARQAAEETRQLQQSTEQLVRAAASGEVPDLKPRLDQIQAEQQQTVGPINDLRDALGEMAATQNLLQADQRAAARDADTSQQILDKATEHMAEALKPAESASSPAAAAGPLEQAAKAQGETRQALEQIAEHFAKLQSGASPDAALAESRQSLSELAQELDMSAMEQWYQTAESLSQLAGIDPQQVLKRLEEELNRNVRMREELSQLAKQALKESVDTLNYSANQERSLQSQLEQSDPAFYQKKNLLQQDIQAATERMKLWMQQLSSDASAVAGRAGARDQQKALSDLQQQLQQTIDQSTPATIALPLTELQQIADKVTQNLQAAEKQFDALAEQLDANSDDPIHANDQELRNRRREMQDWQRRSLLQQSRGAQAIERSHEQRLRQADNARRNADSLLQNAQRQLSELEKKAEKQPDNESLQRQVADANKNIQSLRNELSLAEGRQQSLKLRHERAKQTQVEYAARKVDDLESKNPTAELAGRLSENAANTSRAIAEELRSALTDSGWMQQLAAAQSQLQAGGQTQQRVEQAVGGVAENLRRASRHETRLEHPLMAESIATQAARVEQTGQKEVHTAAEQLAAAADAAKAQMAADAIERATADASLTARSAIHAAEGGLRDRAQDLEQVLAETGKETAKPAEPELPLPAAPSVPLDPKMLARMLDELDRQASEAASNQPQESNEAQNQTPGQNGQPQDDNNQASSQQSSPSSKQRGAQSASMQQAAKQISQQLNQQRSQNRQSTASSRMSSNSADTKPQPPSAVRVLDVDRRAGEDWGKLREQAAEETLESARQTIAPQYRQSVETYFRVLSERGQRGGAP